MRLQILETCLSFHSLQQDDNKETGHIYVIQFLFQQGHLKLNLKQNYFTELFMYYI